MCGHAHVHTQIKAEQILHNDTFMQSFAPTDPLFPACRLSVRSCQVPGVYRRSAAAPSGDRTSAQLCFPPAPLRGRVTHAAVSSRVAGGWWLGAALRQQCRQHRCCQELCMLTSAELENSLLPATAHCLEPAENRLHTPNIANYQQLPVLFTTLGVAGNKMNAGV